MSETYMPQAVFTVQLGSLVENGFDLGLTEYPIFDSEYRETLNAKILQHYWFREIGQETPALFRFMLKRKMNEIMPYYNELYKTEKLEIDMLSTSESTVRQDGTSTRDEQRSAKHDETSEGKASSSNDSTTEGRTLVSVTPQMQLSGHDDYATNLTDSTSSASATATNMDANSRTLQETDALASTGTDSYIQTMTGRSGVLASDAIRRWRDAIINIDIMIIEELAPLFMGVYSDYANYL